MKTVEVAEKKWMHFCQRLEEFCRGAMVTIELEKNGEAKSTVVHNMPLRRLELDEKSDPCNTCIMIEAGEGDQKSIKHLVQEPIHIWLKNGNGSDRYNRLQILAESGTTTIEMHPGFNHALLNEL